MGQTRLHSFETLKLHLREGEERGSGGSHLCNILAGAHATEEARAVMFVWEHTVEGLIMVDLHLLSPCRRSACTRRHPYETNVMHDFCLATWLLKHDVTTDLRGASPHHQARRL